MKHLLNRVGNELADKQQAARDRGPRTVDRGPWTYPGYFPSKTTSVIDLLVFGVSLA